MFHFVLQATADLIKANADSGGKTLVHCIFGVSRSVTLCMTYLMLHVQSEKTASADKTGCLSMGVYEALDYIKGMRRIANPNPGFMAQLVQFEKHKQQSDVDAGDDDDADDNVPYSGGAGDTLMQEKEIIASIRQLTTSLQSEANMAGSTV